MKNLKHSPVLLLCLFLFVSTSNAQSVSGIINSYYKVTDFVAAYNGVRVQNVTGLSVGNRVLLIQMKGAAITTANNSTYGTITDAGSAGNYEFATICGFLNDTVIFERQLLNQYDYSQFVQLVTVPQFTDVAVTGILQAQNWNATTGTGGIIALEASGTITLQANVNATGAGFSGGQLFAFPNCSFLSTATAFSYNPVTSQTSNTNGAYKGEGIAVTLAGLEGGKGKQANGGGGGNNHNTGGGGGSNHGFGGVGGNYVASGFACNGANTGLGGGSLATYGYTLLNNRIFFGGGGGSGHQNNPEGTPGGNGGGIVFLSCNELIGNGFTIQANGSQGINLLNTPSNEARGDGGGGGGGGGVVLLNVVNVTGSLNVEAAGAAGSNAGFQAQCPGPGGGGGGGVIWSSLPLPGTVTTNVAGGTSGIIKDSPNNPACELTSNGATAGNNGTVQSDFLMPEGPLFNCSGVLPLSFLRNWQGRKTGSEITLNWQLENTETIFSVELQKKAGSATFQPVQSFLQPKDGFYQLKEKATDAVMYRLRIKQKNGNQFYSSALFFGKAKNKKLKFYPNPVIDRLWIALPDAHEGDVNISVFDYSGRYIEQKRVLLSEGQKNIIYSTSHLRRGVYSILMQTGQDSYGCTFLKQ